MLNQLIRLRGSTCKMGCSFSDLREGLRVGLEGIGEGVECGVAWQLFCDATECVVGFIGNQGVDLWTYLRTCSGARTEGIRYSEDDEGAKNDNREILTVLQQVWGIAPWPLDDLFRRSSKQLRVP